MDTVYGTKKYFQSLSGGSDIYRSSTCRAVTNDYSYQNTLGRRSSIGAYYHMNKQPTYSTDHSVSSQYGYNTWGMWRDNRNLAPSTFSTKNHQYKSSSSKSFSIILTTAAFIVLLAVISIAGLAFYFSSLKSTLDDPILGFEGSFYIAKGDLYTTGLKYNHTTTYKQKVEFYKRFIDRSLMDNSLHAMKIDILGFGDGPLIKVIFRLFLDMRRMPQNIHSVEDYIKESIFLETTSLKSLYRSIRIDPDSMDVKRILDEKIVKSASLSRENVTPTSQSQLEKRLTKKSGLVEKSTYKAPTSQRSKIMKPNAGGEEEPDIDVENAPVIQGSFEGSFEITKTDADISRKKTTPTKSFTMPVKAVTPHPLRIKPKKPTIEKVVASTLKTTLKMSPSTTAKTTTKSTTTPTTTPTTTTTEPTTPTTKSTTTTTVTMPTTVTIPLSSTTSSTTRITTQTPIAALLSSTRPQVSNIAENSLPQLDVSLFTSRPILDTQPWKPIRPPGTDEIVYQPEVEPDVIPFEITSTEPPFTAATQKQEEIDVLQSGLLPPAADLNIHKDAVFYHSFTNPVFMPGTSGIERLGNANVRPHPLPVPLLDDVVIPPFKPLNPVFGNAEKIQFQIETENDKFEHIGGGVIIKKQEKTESSLSTEAIPLNVYANTPETVSINNQTDLVDESPATELTEKIGEFLLDLLDLPHDEINQTEYPPIESRVEPEDENTKPNFMNLKEIILSRNKENPITTPYNIPRTTPSIAGISSTTTTTTVTTENLFPNNKRNRIKTKPSQSSQINGQSNAPTMLDDSLLFPSHSKWEFINGSSSDFNAPKGSMRKVFNKTLQAWVVEDIDRNENITMDEIKTRINNASNIQDISLIFDTLASKLGIASGTQSKFPPFSPNKFKQAQRNDTKSRAKHTTTTTRTTAASIELQTTTIQPPPLLTTTTKTSFPPPSQPTSEQTLSTIPPLSSSTNSIITTTIQQPTIVEGEAEVELIDPNIYEELLKSSSSPVVSVSTTQSSPTLVTLLPVRSNSGIRTFRHPIVSSLTAPADVQITSGPNHSSSEALKPLFVGGSGITTFGGGNKFKPIESRRFFPSETIVKAGIHVTS